MELGLSSPCKSDNDDDDNDNNNNMAAVVRHDMFPE